MDYTRTNSPLSEWTPLFNYRAYPIRGYCLADDLEFQARIEKGRNETRDTRCFSHKQMNRARIAPLSGEIRAVRGAGYCPQHPGVIDAISGYPSSCTWNWTPGGSRGRR